ncbi:hypothetical protein MASR2M12_26800 [Bacteroidales bacterium]
MKKIALSIALITFLSIGAGSLQSVIAANSGIEISRVDDNKDNKKKEDKTKKSDCTTKKSCCSEAKGEKSADKKCDDKK